MNSIVELYADEIRDRTPGTFYCVINVEPYTKSNRLQFGGKRAFIPKEFKVKDATTKAAVVKAMEDYKIGPFKKPLLMQIDGYLSTKRVFDTCNLPKSIPDAVNHVLFYDDRQIIVCTATKHYDKLNPRVEIFIKEFDMEHPCVNIQPLLDKEKT